METASNIGNLLANQGAAIAGGQLAKGGVARQAFGDLLAIGGVAAGAGAFGGGGAGTVSGGSGLKF